MDQQLVARGHGTLYQRLKMEICFSYFELNIFKMCFIFKISQIDAFCEKLT